MKIKNIKLSLMTPSKMIKNKSIDNLNFTSRFNIHPHLFIRKNDSKISSKRYLYNNDTSIKYPSVLLNNNIPKKSNQHNSIESKKIDSSIQNDFTPIKSYKKSQIKSNLLKNLFMNFPQKNMNPINSVLESPHRGVERLQNNKNNYNTFYKKSFRNLYDLNNNFSYSKYKKDKEIILDKYNKINKKIDNPLEYLSKISGVSCSKLRQIIDFSLSCGINNLEKNILKEELSKSIRLYGNNKYNNIYSNITLKSKKKREILNDYSTDTDNDESFEKIIRSKKFNNIKPICEI